MQFRHRENHFGKGYRSPKNEAIPREGTKVRIGDELYFPERPVPYAHERHDVERLELRVDTDPIMVVENVAKIH